MSPLGVAVERGEVLEPSFSASESNRKLGDVSPLGVAVERGEVLEPRFSPSERNWKFGDVAALLAGMLSDRELALLRQLLPERRL